MQAQDLPQKTRAVTTRARRGPVFLQTDPIGYKDNLDLYEYVGDDPVDASDPSGLEEKKKEWFDWSTIGDGIFNSGGGSGSSGGKGAKGSSGSAQSSGSSSSGSATSSFADDYTSYEASLDGMTGDFLAWAPGAAKEVIFDNPDVAGANSLALQEVGEVGATAKGAVELHHPFPMYLGGAKKQILVPLEKSLHVAYHRGLDVYYKRSKGTAFFAAFSAAKREAVLHDLIVYTKQFDAQHGTNIYGAMLQNLFPGAK